MSHTRRRFLGLSFEVFEHVLRPFSHWAAGLVPGPHQRCLLSSSGLPPVWGCGRAMLSRHLVGAGPWPVKGSSHAPTSLSTYLPV